MDYIVHIIYWVNTGATAVKRPYILKIVKFIKNVVWSFKKKETWHIWKSCPEIFCPKSWGSDYPLSFIIFYTVPHLHLGFLRFNRARRVAVAASRTRTSPMLFPPTIQRADAASPLLGGGSALQTPGPIPRASLSATGKCGRARRVFSIFIFFKKKFIEIYFWFHNLQFYTPTARQGAYLPSPVAPCRAVGTYM